MLLIVILRTGDRGSKTLLNRKLESYPTTPKQFTFNGIEIKRATDTCKLYMITSNSSIYFQFEEAQAEKCMKFEGRKCVLEARFTFSDHSNLKEFNIIREEHCFKDDINDINFGKFLGFVY